MSKCYSDRYPDLKTAFGDNFDQLHKHWNDFGHNEKRNKFCYKDLTDDEATCYLKRFPDIAFTYLEDPKTVKNIKMMAELITLRVKDAANTEKFGAGGVDPLSKSSCPVTLLDISADPKEETTPVNATTNATNATAANLGDGKVALEEYTKNPIQYAKDHYDYWGFYEQRNRHCADRLTDIQAKCYLNAHEDLVVAFGKNWKKAREHYYEYGAKEGRHYKCNNTLMAKECPKGGCDDLIENFYAPKEVKL